MAAVTLIHGDAADYGRACDMILTDPPYEMSGAELARIIGKFDAPHLILITTMRQLLDFMPRTEWRLAFDFVIDGVMPKKSKNYMQPHYLHQTGVYLTQPGVKSAFDRRRRMRSDAFEANGYWPTIFHAPRDNVQAHGHAKNAQAVTDLLGSFNVRSVCDPFAGSGATAIAAYDLGIPCTLIERDVETFNALKVTCRFMSAYGLEIIE
ncbi:hypothetical protein [Coralloluteibacterium thermophilus]|uniref:site-specific DNA-methyltransferase (adenine-specific) n=1 Tax=Coralloluteibacterium thermophilum TaxID=2707049 RepID=A0ABV9NNL4_9GAMM